MLNILRKLLFLYRRHTDPVAHARKIGVSIGSGCRLLRVDFSTEPYLVTLGNHVSASNVQFLTHDGSVWVFRESEAELDLVRPIVVGNNVFLGFGTIILSGVRIGDNVVVGAGSVVSKDIPSNSVAAGVPARVLRSLSDYREKIDPHLDQTKSLNFFEKRRYYLKKFNRLK